MQNPHDQFNVPVKAPTATESGDRIWLYPDRRPGRWARVRGRIAVVLMIIYLVTPWISFQGLPLLRIDVLNGLAYAFGNVFRISDSSLLAFGAITATLFLFLSTTIRGRIWCGYACPQTVFIEWLIRPIEEWIEGPAHHRRAIDAGPKTPKVWLRKILKHAAFLLIAIIVANAFLAYFIAPEQLARWMTQSPAEHPVAFGVMSFIMLAFYIDLAWFREQFCSFICPYARFQSVLFDNKTPAFSYDYHRGEPRGKGSEKGDCIDCRLCVRVCPTGIDIRNGIQLECIMCGRCSDACDSIMKNLNRPLGLIRLDSTESIATPLGARSVPRRDQMGIIAKVVFQLKRPRVIFYGSLLVLFISFLLIRVLGRADLSFTLTRVPGAAYSSFPGEQYGNLFNVRVVNNTSATHDLKLRLLSPERGEVICGACDSSKSEPFSDKILGVMIRFPKDISTPHFRVEHLSSGQVIEGDLIYPK